MSKPSTPVTPWEEWVAADGAWQVHVYETTDKRPPRMDPPHPSLFPTAAETSSGRCTPAARVLGINSGNVVRACTGARPSAHGYVFEYDEPSEAAVLEGEVWVDV